MTRARNISNPQAVTLPLTVSANITTNASIVVGNSTINTTSIAVGNVSINTIAYSVGNSTINTAIHATSISTNGTLSVGNTTITGTQFVNGAVTFANSSSNTVFVTTNGRLGVGTNTPGTLFEMVSIGNTSNIEVRARANNSHYVDMGTTRDGSYHYFFGYGSNTGVAFAANSSIKSYITPDGNMGLGTTTPGSTMAWGLPTFEISGSRPALSLRSTGTLATIRIHSSSGNNNADWHINATVSNTSVLAFGAQSGSIAPPLALTYDGKVGIGNSSPQTTLDVRGPMLVGDYASSGLYNSNAILHVRKTSKPHIVLEDIGDNTCGIAINGTSGMVFGNESGGFEWRTGTSYNGDVTSTGTSRMSLNTSGSLYLGYGLSAPGGYFPYDVGNWTYDANRGYYGDGLTHGSGYPSGSNRPYTYDYCLSVIGGSRGFQLAANWIGGNNISIRTLRDCCSNWFSWVELQQVSSSDRRRKTNIEAITSPRTIIEALEGVKYDVVNEDGTLGDPSVEDPDQRVSRPKEFGYIAQDAQPIIPEAVKYNPLLDTPNELGWASAYHIEYQRLVPVITEAMKEMYLEIDRLKAEIEVLKNA